MVFFFNGFLMDFFCEFFGDGCLSRFGLSLFDSFTVPCLHVPLQQRIAWLSSTRTGRLLRQVLGATTTLFFPVPNVTRTRLVSGPPAWMPAHCYGRRPLACSTRAVGRIHTPPVVRPNRAYHPGQWQHELSLCPTKSGRRHQYRTGRRAMSSGTLVLCPVCPQNTAAESWHRGHKPLLMPISRHQEKCR